MSKVIDVAKFAPKGELPPEQAKYIHGFHTAPWIVTAYQYFWNEYPEHRPHYLKSYAFFRGWNPKHKAATNLKRLAVTAPDEAPKPKSKLRNV